mgnify:CR=1 FL=1
MDFVSAMRCHRSLRRLNHAKDIDREVGAADVEDGRLFLVSHGAIVGVCHRGQSSFGDKGTSEHNLATGYLSGMTILRSLVSTTKMARSLAGSVLLALWLTW